MNPVLLLVSSILAVSQSASVVPIDSSSVSVKQSGQDYSYSIQENHGIAIEPSHMIEQQTPILKTAHIPVTSGNDLVQQVGQIAARFNQEQMQAQGHEQIQGQPSEQTHQQGVQQPKAINYFAPRLGPYQILPNNVQYTMTYPYGLHHPYNIVRVI